jgi:predicted acylesterase/phospholipase RssA
MALVTRKESTSNDPEWIGLALSGGGFRATLFHLGAIRFLHERGLLSKVKLICSVSGGSILAAHLGLNWQSYNNPNEFDEIARSLVDFTQFDLRGRILRRWICGMALGFPRLFGDLSITGLLQRYYSDFYLRTIQGAASRKGPLTLENLRPSSDQPDIHILATSLTTGALFKFTPKGLGWLDGTNERFINFSSCAISLAVAASSAFPPLFPPVAITKDMVVGIRDQFDKTHYLTDGGVFDNLGFSELVRLSSSLPRDKYPYERGLLIVSDAGGIFDWEDKKYSFLVSRNIRASDILMDRVTKLVPSVIQSSLLKTCVVKIDAEIPPDQETYAQESGVQRAAASIRTDLDRFSVKEVVALLRHGYASARFVLGNSGIQSRPADHWGLLEKMGFEPTDQLRVDDLRRADKGTRRWRLFTAQDWVSGLVGAILLLWLAIILAIPIRLMSWFAPYLVRFDFFFPTKNVQILDDFVFVEFEEYRDKSSNNMPLETYVDPSTSMSYPIFDKATFVEHISLRRTKGDYKIKLKTVGIPPEIKSITPAREQSQIHENKAGTLTISTAELESEHSDQSKGFIFTPDVKAIYVYRNGFQERNSWGGKDVLYATDQLTLVYDFSSIAGWKTLFRVEPEACRVMGKHSIPLHVEWDEGVAIVEAADLKEGEKVRIFWTWNRLGSLPPYPNVKCEDTFK